MPAALTYPGVYVEEISSGVRTITGVATSITAFVGRALRGSTTEPVTINSFADFERKFGPVWVASELGFAVRDYYLNGGSTAVIVRVHKNAVTAKATLGAADTEIKFEALSEGEWGNQVEIVIDDAVPAAGPNFPPALTAAGLTSTDVFNVTVTDKGTKVKEVYRNVTVKAGKYDVVSVIGRSSALVKVTSKKTQRPAAETKTLATGSDGDALTSTEFTGTAAAQTGIHSLEKLFSIGSLFNLLCIPNGLDDAGTQAIATEAIAYCEKRRAMYLMDPLPSWSSKDLAKTGIAALTTKSRNAAIFFPTLRQRHAETGGDADNFAPCGAVAGVFARTDTQRGVWKAPAGLDAKLIGVPELGVGLTDDENGELNPKGVNCLRSFPAAGRVVWGARTLVGDDGLADEYKYIPVRRTALFIEESLYRGTQWVVFEPNDEPLWSQIRLNVGAFMNNLFRQGAFQGKTSSEAYFVKCDKETTTQNDIDLGIVNIHVGFAPLKPAEFVVLQIQQIAGSIDV